MEHYKDPKAKRLWEKACDFHKWIDMDHICTNSWVCQRALDEAWAAEMCADGWR